MSEKKIMISCVEFKSFQSLEDKDKVCTANDVKKVVFPKTNEKFTFECIFDEN